MVNFTVRQSSCFGNVLMPNTINSITDVWFPFWHLSLFAIELFAEWGLV
jgi:hypothetical protein